MSGISFLCEVAESSAGGKMSVLIAAVMNYKWKLFGVPALDCRTVIRIENQEEKMRGLYSSKTEIRHKIFTEIARMA